MRQRKRATRKFTVHLHTQMKFMSDRRRECVVKLCQCKRSVTIITKYFLFCYAVISGVSRANFCPRAVGWEPLSYGVPKPEEQVGSGRVATRPIFVFFANIFPSFADLTYFFYISVLQVNETPHQLKTSWHPWLNWEENIDSISSFLNHLYEYL